MKKTIIISIIVITIIAIIAIMAKNNINSQKTSENNQSNKNNVEQKQTGKTSIKTTPSLEDEIQTNTIWCGTFQLIWNDLKNKLAKQDIVFDPQMKVAQNLNKETFTEKDMSDKYYYKKIGTPSIALKEEIEKEILKKFNEKSDILDSFEWNGKTEEDYFLYAMLKKEFTFNKVFDEFENEKFGEYENIKYFGIKNGEDEEQRNQVKVLYYNSEDDFAIKLKTKQEDEVILCKNPEGKTFNEIYLNIENKEKEFSGNKNIAKNEIVKIPNLNLNEIAEFSEIENKPFLFSNGDIYKIEKAMQTIKFELDKTGGKIKSEAGMMVTKQALEIPTIKRNFILDDTFAIFLKENDKEKPYFAGKISDITKFQ